MSSAAMVSSAQASLKFSSVMRHRVANSRAKSHGQDASARPQLAVGRRAAEDSVIVRHPVKVSLLLPAHQRVARLHLKIKFQMIAHVQL